MAVDNGKQADPETVQAFKSHPVHKVCGWVAVVWVGGWMGWGDAPWASLARVQLPGRADSSPGSQLCLTTLARLAASSLPHDPSPTHPTL